MQLVLYFHVRHHFSPDFAKSRKPVRNGEKAVFVEGGNISRDIPALAKHLSSFVRTPKITLHHVGSSDEEETWLTLSDGQHRVGVHDAHRDTGERMTDPASF